jgi:glutathione S-transferase
VLASRTIRCVLSAVSGTELNRHDPGAVPLIPADPRAALEVRLMDRVFDNYVMTPMRKIAGD